MSDTEKSRILIADDIKANINILIKFLKDEYDVSYVKNGIGVLDFVKSNPVDLILLDILMPDLSGYEVCTQLKQDKKTQQIPVIFLTSKNEVQDEKKGLEVGAVDYIVKPFSIPIIKARIKNQLELKKAVERLSKQNELLKEAATLREDIEMITRHDLKTPLNGIIGLSELGQENEDVPEEVREFLKLITDSGYKMLELINRSLDLIKIERGTYNVKFVSVNLLKIIRKLVKDFDTQVSAYKIKILIFLDGEPINHNSVFMVKGEELLCYSMLSNLIGNAVDASESNSVITIHLYRNHGKMLFQIHNEKLVPEDIRSRFFEKYVTKGKIQGTGLGTYSAKLIARTLGGEIEMRSLEGEGTTVSVQMDPSLDV